jgi:t-SNARE complex subunit (syntaxin)
MSHVSPIPSSDHRKSAKLQIKQFIIIIIIIIIIIMPFPPAPCH